MTALQRTWGVVAVPLIAIVMSVIVGSIVIVASEWLVSGEVSPGLAIDAFSALVVGAVGNPRVIVNTLVTTVPLLLGGLSVGLAFKGGLFNIVAQGQSLRRPVRRHVATAPDRLDDVGGRTPGRSRRCDRPARVDPPDGIDIWHDGRLRRDRDRAARSDEPDRHPVVGAPVRRPPNRV